MAVEFAMVAFPLFFMLFAVIELAIVFMATSTLENATSDVARGLRTGAIQMAGGGSADKFRDAICDRMGWLQTSCKADTGLKVDVRTYGVFANPNPPNPISNKTFDKTVLTYQEGGPNDIVLVRSFYQWKLMTPFLNGGLERLSGGIAVLTASATFRNEPYK
jgi:Flp pilus assembly protein TadG